MFQLGSVEVTLATIMDAWPHLENTRLKKFGTYTLIFLVYFLGGIIFTLNSGAYWIGETRLYYNDKYFYDCNDFSFNYIMIIYRNFQY